MALRETQHASEIYNTGGDAFRNTQHATEVYETGGESFRISLHAAEVYCTVEATTPPAVRAYFIGI